jgi:hypothetical protein
MDIHRRVRSPSQLKLRHALLKVVGPLTIIAWGTGCAVGACIPASIAAVLIVIVSGFRASSSGQNGGAILPTRKRDLNGFKVWHDTTDGNVNEFFDPSLLKQGVVHHLWDNRGLCPEPGFLLESLNLDSH